MTAISSLTSTGLAERCPELAQRRGGELVGPTGAPAPCRALVRLSPARSTPPPTTGFHPAAGFLAHLVATAQNAPQTRARRRADPGYADAVYTVAQAGVAQPGRFLRRLA